MLLYQIDSLFIADPTKFISGVLCSLSAMVQLELPHINVLTKCDLVDEKELSKYVQSSIHPWRQRCAWTLTLGLLLWH